MDVASCTYALLAGIIGLRSIDDRTLGIELEMSQDVSKPSPDISHVLPSAGPTQLSISKKKTGRESFPVTLLSVAIVELLRV